MSERMTATWTLYDIASNIEIYEKVRKARFSEEERKCLQEYLEVYEKHLDICGRIIKLEEKLPPHPQINEISIAYGELTKDAKLLNEEIQHLAQTAILQNVLEHRLIPQSKKEKRAAQKRNSAKNMKEWFSSTLGTFGTILYFAIAFFLAALPFVMIGGNFFVTFLLVLLEQLIPPIGIIFWIWGLICAINGPQDFIAIIYYIVFAIAWIPYYISIIISIISTLFNKD